ncbi:MAG: hypothetical protein AB1760_16505 [Pseudomonadota bacterium]
MKGILWDPWWAKAAYGLWILVTGYDTLSGAISQVLPTYELIPLGTLVGRANLLPWWGWLLILQSILWLVTVGYLIERPTAAATPEAGAAFGEEEQLALVEALRRLRGGGTDPHGVKVTFASSAQAPLARRVADLFERAGWTKNFNTTPQEPWKHVFPTGVRVSGFNAALVDGVAAALRSAGLREVHHEVLHLEVPRDNPKYPTAIGSIYVSFGPSEAIVV